MNYILAIVNPEAAKTLDDIVKSVGLTAATTKHGRGTAVESMLNMLGIESNEKRASLAVGNEEQTARFIKEMKRRLYIGVPGHGIVIAVPIKSIGGGSTVAYLNPGEENSKYTPKMNYGYELIVAIANEGRTNLVMNAARKAGATGGTVLHGKGTGSGSSEKFLNVSIASEKEIVLIASKAEQKSEIMRSVLKNAGPDSEAGTILFSLPVSEIAGFGMLFDE